MAKQESVAQNKTNSTVEMAAEVAVTDRKTFNEQGTPKKVQEIIEEKDESAMVIDEVLNGGFNGEKSTSLRWSAVARKSDCLYCGKQVESETALVKHSLKKHGCIKCPRCGKECEGKGVYRKHISRIHRAKLYSCNLCTKTYGNKEGIRRHINGHMGLKPYMCEECSATFADSGDMKKHKKRHIKDKLSGLNKKCTECDETFMKGRLLSTHMYLFHPKVLNQMKNIKLKEKVQVKEHVCDVCGVNATSSEVMNQHFTHVHTDKWDQSILQEHLKARAVAYAKTHTSEETAKKFSVSIASLSKWLNSNGNSHLCEYCTKKFSDRYNLERHVREGHWTIEERQNYMIMKQKVPVAVPKEDTVILQESQVLYEKIYLNDEISMQKEFENKENKSQKEKTADMLECSTRENVQSTTHTKCVYCSKNVNNFVRHVILAHRDVKQFSCDLCDFKATMRSFIRVHMDKEHEYAVFVCPFCAQWCQLRDDLKKHVREKHL